MTVEHVDAVIAAVDRHDPQLAIWMRTAADGLTARGSSAKAGLLVFLWYEVPRDHPKDAWRPVTEAAGALLSLLGVDRYAVIARSPTAAPDGRARVRSFAEPPQWTADAGRRLRASRTAPGGPRPHVIEFQG